MPLHNLQSYAVRVLRSAAISRDDLVQKLLGCGISTRRGIMSSHREPRLCRRQAGCRPAGNDPRHPRNYGAFTYACAEAPVLPAFQVAFPATAGQYIRLRALSEINGGPWTSAAEINVLGQ